MSATPGTRFGYTQGEWDQAKEEMRRVLVEHARASQTIEYSELVALVRTIRLEPDSHALAHMLGEISTEEDALGRGMLTVLVVHKGADGMPGPGFFDLPQARPRYVRPRTSLGRRDGPCSLGRG